MDKYGLIGHPLGHSMSPLIHEKLFALSGISDSSYELIDIAFLCRPRGAESDYRVVVVNFFGVGKRVLFAQLFVQPSRHFREKLV